MNLPTVCEYILFFKKYGNNFVVKGVGNFKKNILYSHEMPWEAEAEGGNSFFYSLIYSLTRKKNYSQVHIGHDHANYFISHILHEFSAVLPRISCLESTFRETESAKNGCKAS